MCIAGKSRYNATVLLPVAVQCFIEQDYPNKELVVVYDDNWKAVGSVSQRFDCKDVRWHVTDKAPLGALRNKSIEFASSGLLVQWDSDDAFHPHYVSVMVRTHLQSQLPVFLKRQLVYDLQRDVAAVRSFPKTCIHGANLLPRGDWRYPEIGATEDTEILKHFPHVALLDAPELYLRMFTGDNTWDRLHVMREASEWPSGTWMIPERAIEWVREVTSRYSSSDTSVSA